MSARSAWRRAPDESARRRFVDAAAARASAARDSIANQRARRLSVVDPGCRAELSEPVAGAGRVVGRFGEFRDRRHSGRCGRSVRPKVGRQALYAERGQLKMPLTPDDLPPWLIARIFCLERLTIGMIELYLS